MNESYPVNRSAAVTQHAAGNAEHWSRCESCKAAASERCYNLARNWPGRERPRKRNPCAGRVWRAAS